MYGLWLNSVVILTQGAISGSRCVLYWKCWWFMWVNGKWLDTKVQNQAAKEDVLFSTWRFRGQLRLDLADCCASKRPHLMIQRSGLDCSPDLCAVWGSKTDFVLQLFSQSWHGFFLFHNHTIVSPQALSQKTLSSCCLHHHLSPLIVSTKKWEKYQTY